MPTSSSTQRAVAEINFGEGAGTQFKIGNRTVHQFWHLYSSHCRHLLLAPQRRPDTGSTAWTWREALEKRPVTSVELADVRRRLAEASRSLNGGATRLDPDDDSPASGGATLEGQVRASVSEMLAQLIALRDAVLIGYVCRTEAGLMLHSWGAAVAAEPRHPDKQNGEISGLLLVGDDRPVGVLIALESPQGASIARVKSDSTGHFRFPNIAPGHYRVRVLERSDFPANGVPVTMEHESITGLELCSAAGESPTLPTAQVTAAIDGTPPWYKRRWIRIIALLLLLGIGSCVWRTTRSANSPTGQQLRSEEWQSAKDQVAAGDAKGIPGDDRKVGTDPAWSTLSKSIHVPKASSTPSFKTSAGAGSGATDRTSPYADEPVVAKSRAAEVKIPSNDSSGKSKPENGVVARPKSKESNGLPSDKSGEEKSREEESGMAAPDVAAAKTAEVKLAKSSPEVAAKKKATHVASADAPGEGAPADSTMSPGGDVSEKTPAASSAGSGGAKDRKSAKAPGPTGNEANHEIESAAAAADEGGANSPPDSAASTPSGNQSKAASGKKSNSVAAGSHAAEASPESNATSAAVETSPDTPEDVIASKKSPSSSAPKKQSPAGSGAPSAKSAEQPKEAPQSVPSASPAAKTSTKKIAARPPVGAGKPSSSTPSPSAPSSPAAAEADDASDSPAPTDSTKKSTSPIQKKPSPRSPAAAVPTPGASESELSHEAVAPAGTDLSSGPALTLVTADAPLVRFGKVRVSAWKLRLLQDQILPTRPMTAAEEEVVEAMREKLLQARRAQIPAVFLQPRAQHGIILELPVGGDSLESSLRWRDETGAEPNGAKVVGTRAELTWAEDGAPRGREYILSTLAGHERARVTVESSGALVLKVELAAKAGIWVGVDGSSTRVAKSGLAVDQPRFDWRLVSGESVPASWSRDDRWLEGRGWRLEIPLDITSKRVGNYGLALLDQSTGWALVCDVAVQ